MEKRNKLVTGLIAGTVVGVTAGVLFRASYVVENAGLPNLFLGINYQAGAGVFWNNADYVLIQGAAGAKFFVDGGWRDSHPLSEALTVGTWYRAEIKQVGPEITGTISKLDGTVLQENTYTSSVKVLSTGAAWIRCAGGGTTWVGSPAFDDFSLEIVPPPDPTDDFNRDDSVWSLGPDWGPAFSRTSFSISGNLVVPDLGYERGSYYTTLADEAPAVTASILFRASFVAENMGFPGLFFGINHQGGTAGDIWSTDFIMIQGVVGAKFYVDGDWRDTNPLAGLATGDWYKMEITQIGAELTGRVLALDGTILQQNSYTSLQESATGAAYVFYGGQTGTWGGSPAFDDFYLDIATASQPMAGFLGILR